MSFSIKPRSLSLSKVLGLSGPPSPTFSDATTHASAISFGADGPAKIITRSNLKASVQAYEDLVSTCTNYRAALVSMSKATASFADAMERCSALKGPSYETGTRLQAAAGVHHLIGNLWHVLSETIDNSFERPLRHQLDTYRAKVNERSAAYERALRERSQLIHETETRSMKKKHRNMQSFREALAVLQRQVDELDEMKAAHYEEIIEHEEEVWNFVQGKICVVLRSSMDVFDRFTAKASDPVLEPMLSSVPDPFDAYGPPQAEDQIFSILAPLSIMSTAPSSTASPLSGSTPERELYSPTATASKITSWLPGASGTLYSPESNQWTSVAAAPAITPAQSISPPASTRRHSVPASPRKAESKLRSVLSVIDESRSPTSNGTGHHRGNGQEGGDGLVSPLLVSPRPPALGFNGSNVAIEPSASYDTEADGELTPRRLTFLSRSPPPLGSEPILKESPPSTEPDQERAPSIVT